MAFKLEIDTSNDAFKPDPSAELLRILERVSKAITVFVPGRSLILRDCNGNCVGTATLTTKEE